MYPWGNCQPSYSLCNYNYHAGDKGDAIGTTSTVGDYSPQGDSGYGCCDMAGNVWEWCLSLYVDYPYNAVDGRNGTQRSGFRVLRGGAWDAPAISMGTAYRGRDFQTVRPNCIGFRVVVNDNS